jgi:hypothetical protein
MSANHQYSIVATLKAFLKFCKPVLKINCGIDPDHDVPLPNWIAGDSAGKYKTTGPQSGGRLLSVFQNRNSANHGDCSQEAAGYNPP